MTELNVEPGVSKKPALAWCPAQNTSLKYQFKSQSEWSRTHLPLWPSISPPSFCSHTTGMECANIPSCCLLVLSLTSGPTLGVLRFYMLPLLSRKTLQTKSKDAQIPILREGVIDRKSTSTVHSYYSFPPPYAVFTSFPLFTTYFLWISLSTHSSP